MEVYNFSAGPAMLPREVHEELLQGWSNWRDMQASIVEISHRSDQFMRLMQELEQEARELLSIPKNYRVLFLQGGAQGQFALIPMNLLGKNNRADYLTYGHWSQRACDEAMRYGQIHEIGIRSDTTPYFLSLPSEWTCSDEAAYVHFCTNETIDGMMMPNMPHSKAPWVADMSSDILSKPIDVSQYGLIYACAQKNMGVPGLVMVIVREDLLDQAMDFVPSVFDYKKQNEMKSLYNTANTFACYVMHLMLAWNKRQGGPQAMQVLNERKASKLYAAIDQSDGVYTNKIEPAYRSIMNVTFSLPTPELEARFLQEAANQGLLYLRGHKVAGGIRASIYNAMPEKGVDLLVEFMQAFCRRVD